MDDLTRAWLEHASAAELAQIALRNIERWNGRINAMLTPLPEEAMAMARACDEARAAGRRLGPLHGMPVALKDNVDMAGVRTTVASDFFRDNVAGEDAELVRRLRRAGAVIVGKANLHEFALGAVSQSRHLGPCFNPWRPEHVPGGSSGGSGAAVASGMCVMSVGTDTGGSIRAPASFNGVAGLKPTNGAVPNRGTFPVSPPHDTPGPLARRVEDVAAAYMAMAGFDPADPTSEDRAINDALQALNDGVAGRTIGVPRPFFFDDLQPAAAKGVEEAIRVLRELGATIREIELPDAEEAWRLASTVLIMADACALHAERMQREPQRMGPDVFARIAVGRDVSGLEYARAMRFRESWRQRVAAVFRSGVDLLALPTTPFTAPRVDPGADMGRTSNRINRNNFPWSLAGAPALSLPCGFDEAGLPFGLQLVGPRWGEAVLMAAGKAYQGVTDWHLRAPTPES
jgi:aspartyl-tRNA(Asn)/glutamyl-tRNA(Gln) amidotransferase subunit A